MREVITEEGRKINLCSLFAPFYANEEPKGRCGSAGRRGAHQHNHSTASVQEEDNHRQNERRHHGKVAGTEVTHTGNPGRT